MSSDASSPFSVSMPAPVVRRDTRAWRAEMTTPDSAELRRRFDRFRKNYSSRREFAACRLHLHHASPALLETAAAFGFQICSHRP